MHFGEKTAVSAKFLATILHFGRKMAVSAKFLDAFLHFRRKTAVSAQFLATILHFGRKMAIPAQFLGTFLHFSPNLLILQNFWPRFCILEEKRRFLHNLLNTSAKRTWCCPENKFVELYFHNNYTIHAKSGIICTLDIDFLLSLSYFKDNRNRWRM